MRRAPLVCLVLAAGCAAELLVGDFTRTDTWSQSPSDEVDILFVVDNSNSMELEQSLLAAGFDAFIANIEEANANFQIGIITTAFEADDPTRGVLIGDPPFLTRDSVALDPTTGDELGYVELFRQRALVGLTGPGREKGLEAATYALSPNLTATGGANEGFLRPEASLLVVVVSDEDDCSDGGALGPAAKNVDCYEKADRLLPVSLFKQRFEGIKGDANRVQFAAIVGPEDAESVCGQTTLPGRRYMEVARLTGGLSSSICEPERVWRDFLFQVGLNASGVLTTFELSAFPNLDTLAVFVDDVAVPQDETDGWTYDAAGPFLTFHGASVPPRGSQIRAEYTVGSATGPT